MNEAFVSCKREDESRVGRLVRAFVRDEGCSPSSVRSRVVSKAKPSASWRRDAFRKRRSRGDNVRVSCPWIVAVAVVWCVVRFALAHGATVATGEVDARAEIAAALFAASATQAAAERVADVRIRLQRKEIEELRGKVRAGDAQRKAELTAAEEEYIAGLAERDRAYAQEIAVFRKAVEDIAATPEGAAALARFNAGDEIGALTVLDDLRAARDAARQKRANIESAADARHTATLALEARNRG